MTEISTEISENDGSRVPSLEIKATPVSLSNLKINGSFTGGQITGNASTVNIVHTQHEINSHNIFFNTSNAASGDELGNSPVSPTPSGLAPYTPQGDEIAAPIVNLVNIHESSRKYIVVVAIDFGTAFSGYAFCFVRDPGNIHIMRRWEGGDPGINNQKTPSCLLLDPNQSFHSFGYSARDHFHDLDAQEAKKWLYFDKFKMTLYNELDITKDTTITAVNGKEVSAMKVFSLSLMFFREHALQELTDQSSVPLTNQDIRWVITVPAIWRESAKQFMRQAAYVAGMATSSDPEQLLIALEPEAASIHCRRLRKIELADVVPKTKLLSVLFPEDLAEVPERLKPATELHDGTKYMVVDCGGGTVDITVHAMDSEQGCLKELYKASGGPYGSVSVDVAFAKLLESIFGADFIVQYKSKRPAGWVDFMLAFESRKRSATPFKDNPLNISIPFSFFDYYRKMKNQSVESAIRRFDDKNVRWSPEGMLRLTPSGMLKLFQPTLDNIVRVIREIFDNEEYSVGTVEYIFLVGGFAESPLLQKHIRDAFTLTSSAADHQPSLQGAVATAESSIQVIIPQGTSLCVLKGAVLFGLDPTIVRIRRPKVTYGVGVLNKFVDGKHDPTKKIVGKDGQAWVTDIFDPFVKSGQAIAQGEIVTRSYTPAKSSQKQIVVNIYAADNETCRYITDKGVRRCGTLNIDLSQLDPNDLKKGGASGKRRRELQLTMQFGETEIKVSAFDVLTKAIVKADINFLSR